jgi:hypothetical protein
MRRVLQKEVKADFNSKGPPKYIALSNSHIRKSLMLKKEREPSLKEIQIAESTDKYIEI